MGRIQNKQMTLPLFIDEEKKKNWSYEKEPLTYYVISKKTPDEILITGIPKGTQVLNQFAMKKRIPNPKLGLFIYYLDNAQVTEKRGRAFLSQDVKPEDIFFFDFGEWTSIISLYP